MIATNQELQKPLGLIQDSLERILKGNTNSKEKQDELLELMIKQISHIRELLDFKSQEEPTGFQQKLNITEVLGLFYTDGLKMPLCNADKAFVRRMNSIIEENIENSALNVDLLVDQMGMSKSTLYAKMKITVGLGVNTYINNYRIKYASRLLIDSDLPISDVSFKAGFSSQGYFSTLFKQCMNYTPKDYRKQKKVERRIGKMRSKVALLSCFY